MIQVERTLQTEIMWHLKLLPVVAIAVPNGIHLPAHSEDERRLVGRLMKRLISDGMVTPGAPDLVVCSATGACFLELKRPASRDLFGRRTVRGRLSEAQREFHTMCAAVGVPYEIASNWPEAQAALRAHKVIA